MLTYRCCEHCGPKGVMCPTGVHPTPCSYPACPGRMPIVPETEG